MTEQTQESNGQFDEIYANQNPARNSFESYEDYKKRRTETNQALKQYLRGKLIFNSSPQFLGTNEEGKEIWSSPRTYRKVDQHV